MKLSNTFQQYLLKIVVARPEVVRLSHRSRNMFVT